MFILERRIIKYSLLPHKLVVMCYITVTRYHFTSVDSAVSEQQYIAHISRGTSGGTEREIILKPIWHIYVDKLFKGITLSINMFVYWSRVLLFALWLWKTVLLHMVMSEKIWKHKGWVILVFCRHLTLPWKSTFHFHKQALKSCFFSKAGLCNLLVFPIR